MKKALSLIVTLLVPAAAAAQTHTWDFPGFLQDRKLAIMFSMSWFGIPSTDPQGNIPSGTADKRYGNWQVSGSGTDSTANATQTTTCILIGREETLNGSPNCLQTGAAQRKVASRRKPLAGLYSSSGRNYESQNRVRLMLTTLRRSCDDGARVDAWAVQIKSVKYTSKYFAETSSSYDDISDYNWRALKTFFNEADAAGMHGVILPGYDETDYFNGFLPIDCSANRQACVDAIGQDLGDLAAEALQHPSALTYNGKPVLLIYVPGGSNLSLAEYRDQVFPAARSRAGTDFYTIGMTGNAQFFQAFDALAPWISSSTWASSTGNTLAERAYDWTKDRHKGLLYEIYRSGSPYKDANGNPTRAVLGSVTPGFDDWTRNWGGSCERQIPNPSPGSTHNCSGAFGGVAGQPRDPVLLEQQLQYFTDCRNGLNCIDTAGVVPRYDFRAFVAETWDDWTEGSELEPDVLEGPSRLVKLRQELGDYWGERGTTADVQGDQRLADRWNNYGQARNGSTTSPAGTPPRIDLACAASFSDSPLPLTVAAASLDDGNVPQNTLDDNLATRWASQYDGAFITYGLGATKTVGSVQIAWHLGDTRTESFSIQVSPDNATWTTVLSATSSGASLAQQHFSFSPVSARYVKYVGHTNSQNNWNAVTEFDVYGKSQPVIDLPAAVIASSPNDGNVPENTLDGDLATRWASQNDGAYITYDLGGPRTVASVDIAWNLGDTRTDDFDIQVSSDGVAWTTVLSHQISSGMTLDRQLFDFPDAVARYVKYVGHTNSANNWNAVTELDILGR